MDNKDLSPKKRLLSNVAAVLIMLWVFVLIMLPFFTIGLFLDGYPRVALILLLCFVVQIIILILYFRRCRKKRVEKEAAFRAENIVEYERDGGRLGVLRFEYNRKTGLSFLNNGFPAIFSENEVPELSTLREREDGRTVERIADRLLEDRDIIIEGVLREYARRGQANPTGLELEEISVEKGGEEICCEFHISGVPEEDSYALVSYAPDADGYNFKVLDDDYE